MACLFQWIGSIVVLLLVTYAALYFYYKSVRREVPASIDPDAMPLMQPLPIPTINQPGGLMKLLVMLYEVRRWSVKKNWTFTYQPEGENAVEIIIPKGFRFDGASIPRPFWNLLSPIGLLLIPGLVHDYGYRHDQLWIINADGKVEAWNKGAGKDFWDNVFLCVGKQVNGFALIDKLAWVALKIGGQGSWDSNRWRNEPITKPVIRRRKTD